MAEPGSASPSRAGSLTSTAAASSRPTARMAARGFSSTCLSYRALKARAHDGRMYDVEPAHAVGLYAALIALPLAVLAVRRSPQHRSQPGTVQIACVLMAVTGAVHLALIPQHLASD